MRTSKCNPKSKSASKGKKAMVSKARYDVLQAENKALKAQYDSLATAIRKAMPDKAERYIRNLPL